jgi:PIN domain nuclease of toxin-antitoxin system
VGGTPLSAVTRRSEEPPYLLDTHIWIWYVTGSARLSAGLRAAIDSAIGRLWLSPISVWEVGMLHARRRIEVADGPRRWVERALIRFPLIEASLTREVALRSHEVELGHGDPADRLIAATALVHDLTLITLDERLAHAPGLVTRSA